MSFTEESQPDADSRPLFTPLFWSSFFKFQVVITAVLFPFTFLFIVADRNLLDALLMPFFFGFAAAPFGLIYTGIRCWYGYSTKIEKSEIITDEVPNDPDTFSEPLYRKSAKTFWEIVAQRELLMLLIIMCMCLPALLPDILGGFVMTWVFGIIMLPLALILAARQTYLHKTMGNVHFDGETVSVYDQSCHHTYTAKFTDCRWFIGSRTWATIPDNESPFVSGGGKAFLIVFPDSIKKELGNKQPCPIEAPAIIAAGLTPETRLQWKHAAERLNVEKDVDRQFLPPPLSNALALFLGVPSIVGAFYIGLGFWAIAELILLHWLVPADIVRGLAFSFFLPGALYLMCILLVLPHWGRGRKYIYHYKSIWDLPSQEVTLPIVLELLFLALYWIAIGQNGWTIHSAIAATFANVAMTMVMVFILAEFWQKKEQYDGYQATRNCYNGAYYDQQD